MTATTKCPICSADAEGQEDFRTDDLRVTCDVCGRYAITRHARTNLPHELDEAQRSHLSAVTRRASDEGAPLLLRSDSLRTVLDENPRPPGPVEMMELLLGFVGRKAPIAGQAADVRESDYPIAFARGPAELAFLLSSLEGLGWIKRGSTQESRGRFHVTIDGWRRLAELKTKPRQSRTAFVAMSYEASLNDAWERGFKATLHALGYDPVRVDREEHNEKVDDYMIARIRESAILIADATGHRNNVHWEAGFALGLGIPVIWTCRQDEIEKASFDTRQYHHVTWTDPDDLAKKLRARIEATITDRPAPRTNN